MKKYVCGPCGYVYDPEWDYLFMEQWLHFFYKKIV